MVGASIVRKLQDLGYKALILRTHSELDLTNQKKVNSFFTKEKPHYVFLTAARVGGIEANRSYPAEFLYENLMIQNNVIKASVDNDVKKFIFLGSSCIYPRKCPQPMKEESLMTGSLEPTNEGYALSKIAGLKLLSYYEKQRGFRSICPMPCNLYGTNDSFDPINSHVVAALVKKFVDAVETEQSQVVMWGTGRARRELMHVDDMVDALFIILEKWNTSSIINVGWGEDISIKELAHLIAEKTGYHGNIQWDISKPDGMPRKCLDVTNLKKLGFKPRIKLENGIEEMIAQYKQTQKTI